MDDYLGRLVILSCSPLGEMMSAKPSILVSHFTCLQSGDGFPKRYRHVQVIIYFHHESGPMSFCSNSLITCKLH